MKLWQKDYQVLQEIDRFTVGRDREMDLALAPFDILGSLAHIQMLTSIGLLEEAEYSAVAAALKGLYHEAKKGNFRIEDDVEDVHSQVEMLLTRQLGDAGKKIHSGRSRNDQVLVDLRLYFRAEIEEVVRLAEGLFRQLQLLSEQHREVLMPGYTHFQVAMVSSFGLWFGAYAESLVDDLRLLSSVYAINNQNPLGSAAGYGSSFPLDRRMTTELLGFADLNFNVVHAQLGRGKTELFLTFALAAFGSTLGKLAADVVLFMNQNFGFIRFPDELTTGSSIMPHKKNPDVFELIRAKCNQLQALPGQVSMLTTNLPAGYHRDFQLLKEALFPALQTLKSCLSIATFALEHIEVQPNVLAEEKYRYLFSVEEVNRLVLEGMPFRDAYQEVGKAIAEGRFDPDRSRVAHVHEGSIGNLCTADIRAKWEAVMQDFPFAAVAEKIDQLTR
ncbi:MAG: argininosuccinate lyase [Lewinellaceae bacterium]|nr:argininosuccinate lyase [Lewinellaceae bacterium]